MEPYNLRHRPGRSLSASNAAQQEISGSESVRDFTDQMLHLHSINAFVSVRILCFMLRHKGIVIQNSLRNFNRFQF